MRTLDKFLLQNGNQLEQVDKYVNYLTMFLPGQTPTVELACEAVVTSTAILQTYKNQVVAKITGKAQKDLRSRYLDAEYLSHRRYRQLAYLLSVIKSTELLVEMTALYGNGKPGKWNAVFGIEALKAAIRLGMLGISRRPLPAAVPVHELEIEDEDVAKLVDIQANGAGSKFAKFDLSAGMTASGARLEPLNHDNLRPPGQLLRKFTPQLLTSEVLSTLRPLIYAVMLYKYRSRKKSWTPWLIGISIEFLARELARGSLNSETPRRPATGLEKTVYQQRDCDMLWWLMRGAMFENYTRGFLMTIANKLSKIPLINITSLLVTDAVDYFDEYYFGSATL